MQAAVKTFEFVERVASSKTSREVAALLLSEAEHLGFSGLAMGWLPGVNSAELAHFEVASLPAEYFRRYAENHYEQHSAIVSHMATTASPFRWDQVAVDEEAQPLAKVILHEAWEFGVRWGWTIPIYSRSGLSGFVTTSASKKLEDGITTDQLHLMALCAHSRVKALNSSDMLDIAVLTQRERDVMSWLAVGRSPEDISSLMGVSPRTVHYHIASAGHKFGTLNPTHTVVESIRRRQITI